MQRAGQLPAERKCTAALPPPNSPPAFARSSGRPTAAPCAAPPRYRLRRRAARPARHERQAAARRATRVWVPADVRGDGRLRDGSPALPDGLSNEYQGNFCSVNAVIGSGLKGEGTLSFALARLASTTLPASCLPTRYNRYYLNGPNQPPANASTQELVAGFSSLAVGQTLVQPFHSGTMAELGYALWWDDAYPPANSMLATRLPNVVDEYGRSVRQWRWSLAAPTRPCWCCQRRPGRAARRSRARSTTCRGR